MRPSFFQTAFVHFDHVNVNVSYSRVLTPNMEQTDTQNAVCNRTYHMNYLLTKTQKYNKTSSGSEINYNGYKSINRQKKQYNDLSELRLKRGERDWPWAESKWPSAYQVGHPYNIIYDTTTTVRLMYESKRLQTFCSASLSDKNHSDRHRL